METADSSSSSSIPSLNALFPDLTSQPSGSSQVSTDFAPVRMEELDARLSSLEECLCEIMWPKAKENANQGAQSNSQVVFNDIDNLTLVRASSLKSPANKSAVAAALLAADPASSFSSTSSITSLVPLQDSELDALISSVKTGETSGLRSLLAEVRSLRAEQQKAAREKSGLLQTLGLTANAYAAEKELRRGLQKRLGVRVESPDLYSKQNVAGAAVPSGNAAIVAPSPVRATNSRLQKRQQMKENAKEKETEKEKEKEKPSQSDLSLIYSVSQPALSYQHLNCSTSSSPSSDTSVNNSTSVIAVNVNLSVNDGDTKSNKVTPTNGSKPNALQLLKQKQKAKQQNAEQQNPLITVETVPSSRPTFSQSQSQPQLPLASATKLDESRHVVKHSAALAHLNGRLSVNLGGRESPVLAHGNTTVLAVHDSDDNTNNANTATTDYSSLEYNPRRSRRNRMSSLSSSVSSSGEGSTNEYSPRSRSPPTNPYLVSNSKKKGKNTSSSKKKKKKKSSVALSGSGPPYKSRRDELTYDQDGATEEEEDNYENETFHQYEATPRNSDINNNTYVSPSKRNLPINKKKKKFKPLDLSDEDHRSSGNNKAPTSPPQLTSPLFHATNSSLPQLPHHLKRNQQRSTGDPMLPHLNHHHSNSTGSNQNSSPNRLAQHGLAMPSAARPGGMIDRDNQHQFTPSRLQKLFDYHSKHNFGGGVGGSVPNTMAKQSSSSYSSSGSSTAQTASVGRTSMKQPSYRYN